MKSRIIKVSVRVISLSLVNSELTLSKQVLVTCQGKILLIVFLATAVAVAVRAKSGTPGERDLISPTRPHHLLNGVFSFELFSHLTRNKDNKMFIFNKMYS